MDLNSFCDRAIAHHRKGELEEAERLYQAVIAADPANFTACHLLGILRFHQGRNLEALELIGTALSRNPEDAEALCSCGNVLQALGRFEDALARYDAAIAARPGYAEAFYNRGVILSALHRIAEALENYDRALAIEPRLGLAWNNRGNVLYKLRRLEEALASYDAALAVLPDYADALTNRGVVLRDLNRGGEALMSFDRALALRPGNEAALYNRANALRDVRRLEEAFRDYVAVLAINPGHAHARDGAAAAALNLCDWPRTAQIGGLIQGQAARGKSIVSPFTLLGYSGDPALQLQCARDTVGRMAPVPALWEGTIYAHDKIRIAYLSADLRTHATASLMADLFERHDRSRFEVTAVSFGADDASAMRGRLVKAFDRFHDAAGEDDAVTAQRLRDWEVDIAIDLNGHTNGGRPEILKRRPAPVQVNYLGFPGTMGAEFIDYVIADPLVLPFAQQTFFTERIVHLPDCYQVNNSKRTIAEPAPSRAAAGLPADAFVFCCFNNNWKITAPLFDIWMRLLAEIPGSVLWLIADSDEAGAHLRHAAGARGIDPGRLVFAPRIEPDAHLARHRLADLFVDTLPVNAHTTASDALWAGLPLVTCRGTSFSGRVAASLLASVGLGALATDNLEGYEALALQLARDPALLAFYRQKLVQGRQAAPLFDTVRFQRNIEAAFVRMWEIAQRGEAPQSFGIS